jgi:hypothetical protein
MCVFFFAVSAEDASEKPETDDEGIEQDSGDGTDDGAVSKVPPFSFDSGPLHAIITKVIEVRSRHFRFDPTAIRARLIYFVRRNQHYTYILSSVLGAQKDKERREGEKDAGRSLDV